MTDVRVETEPAPERRRRRPQSLAQPRTRWSRSLLILVGAVAYFGYSVYRDRQANFATSAAGRLVGCSRSRSARTPTTSILRVRLGEALGGMGKYAEATEQLNAALKIDPKHIGAHLDLGLVAVAAENPNAAESYFKKVVELTEGSQYAALDSVARDSHSTTSASSRLRRSATTRRPASSRPRLPSARMPRTPTTSSRRRSRAWVRPTAPSSSSRSVSSSIPASPRRTTSWVSSTRRRRTT